MARIRTIKPDFFTSQSIAVLPLEARYLFVGLLTEADDQGRMVDSAKRLAGAIFPYDDRVTAAKVDGWLNAIAKTGAILRYEVGGARYICFQKWADHQKISNPAKPKLPSPSADSLEDVGRSSGGKGKEGEWE